MKKIARLTDLEIKIMKVLWEHEQNLTIQEIAGCLEEERISTASVTQAIKHLVAKKAVTVCEHVLVTSVYARTFSTCFTQEEFLAAEFKRLQKFVFGAKNANSIGIAAALLSSDNDETVSLKEVEKIQKYIDDKMKQLKNGEV